GPFRGEGFAPSDRNAPEATINRIGRAGRWQRQPVVGKKCLLSLALPMVIPNRGEDLEARVQRTQRNLEAHLVVSCRGATVRHRSCTPFGRYARESGRLHPAFRADAERIELSP